MNERPNVAGDSNKSRSGAPSRKGCVVNGQMTQASTKSVRPPPPSPLAHPLSPPPLASPPLFSRSRSHAQFQFIIADESHFLKSVDAQRSLAVVPLMQRAGKFSEREKSWVQLGGRREGLRAAERSRACWGGRGGGCRVCVWWVYLISCMAVVV